VLISVQLQRFPLLAGLVALTAAPAFAQGPPSEAPEEPTETVVAPLFLSHDLLEFSVHAPWDEIRKDRGDDREERPAELRLEGGAPLPLQVRTRGNFRRQRSTCPAMPPIRLNFPTQQMNGTEFAGQDKLKLVTHCRSRDSDEQNLLQEYLVYRVFNELTPNSFGARLARVTYVDSARPDDEPVTKFAFIIEAEEALAERLGGMMLEVPQAHPADYDRDGMLTVALFEYMVGNTDWSLVQFHNIRLFQSNQMKALPIPYDFDWTGLVSAPYAEPNESLRIRSVRDRVYRGYCVDGLDYSGVAAHFRAKKSAVLALVDQIPGLSEDTANDSREYLEEFFETLEDPDKYEGRVVSRCRKLG